MATRDEGVKTIIYPVTDLAKAKAIYGSLVGVEPYADQPYYVGWKVADQDIGLDPTGHRKGMTGPVAYHHVDDITGVMKALVDAGAVADGEPRNVGGGRLIVSLKDPDGNPIGLLQDP